MNVRERSARRIANLAQQPDAGWCRIVRNDAGPTRVDIYDEIGGHWLFGGVSAADFAAQLAEITGDLEVHINSPGGDVFDGLAIYNSLAQRPGAVTTIVDGLAASAASFIAQAGKSRVIAPGAMMMIHDASGVCIGDAGDMRELAGLLDKVSGNLADIYGAHSGKAWGWREAMQAETWYTAQEAVDAGLADRLAARPAGPDALAAAARFDLSVYARVPARLRAAASPHGPFTGSHAHPHPANGDQGGDAAHEHEHAHDGDASHGHEHPSARGRTLGAESMPLLLAKAIAIHHTATVDTAWDGPAAVAAMPAEYADLHYCHAWQDATADSSSHTPGDGDADDKKGNFKFPHHKTKGGPANLAACRNGKARLSGADIPDGDRAGVQAHLQAHLDDGGGDDGASDHTDPGFTLDPAGIMKALKEAFK